MVDQPDSPNTSDGTPEGVAVREVTYTSSDGLALFARDYGDRLSPWLPVVCLAGLSRSSRDFDALARHLASHRHRPRRVVCFDYRGRGLSQWAKTADSYSPVVEMNDIFDGMAALGIARAIVVGTSRGGIIGMLMGVVRPATLAGLVLNDVGPVLEVTGLARIKTYVGRTPAPTDWADAARILRHLHGARFTGWSDADWDAYARQTFRETEDGPAGDYDPKLGETLDGIELDQPAPTLWNEFRALKAVPIMVIRGENSDLLSAGTVAAMSEAHPGLEALTVPGEGHAPVLRGALLEHISAFISAGEGSAPPAETIAPRPEAQFNLDDAPEEMQDATPVDTQGAEPGDST